MRRWLDVLRSFAAVLTLGVLLIGNALPLLSF